MGLHPLPQRVWRFEPRAPRPPLGTCSCLWLPFALLTSPEWPGRALARAGTLQVRSGRARSLRTLWEFSTPSSPSGSPERWQERQDLIIGTALEPNGKLSAPHSDARVIRAQLYLSFGTEWRSIKKRRDWGSLFLSWGSPRQGWPALPLIGNSVAAAEHGFRAVSFRNPRGWASPRWARPWAQGPLLLPHEESLTRLRFLLPR